jgi:hypothetical protein
MKQFVSERASTKKLNERIHAIWQAIICMRLYLIVIFSLTGIASQWMSITERSRRLRKGSSLNVTPTMARCDYNVLDGVTDSSFAPVPVIAVFTKFDALSAVALGKLRRIPGLTRKDQFERTPELVEEIFTNANIWGRLCGTRYPPKNYVRLASKLIHHFSCMACNISHYRNEHWWNRLWAASRMHDGCLRWRGLATVTNINTADEPGALYHLCCGKVISQSLDSVIDLTLLPSQGGHDFHQKSMPRVVASIKRWVHFDAEGNCQVVSAYWGKSNDLCI